MVELSLSTLTPDAPAVVATENPAERDVSNRIQKEIVKQLLYRLPTRTTRHSRFPRASTPSWRGAGIALLSGIVVAAVAWVLTLFLDWQELLTDRLAELGWPMLGFWVALSVAMAGLALLLWRVTAGRYAVQAGVKTGALTLSLEPTSSSYFDQYLDEIMYFFQASKTKLVLIEDVDRFSDATVLDTLRALNHLVNTSRQIGRRVVFIYAIRDSVLGQLGPTHKTLPAPEGVVDEAEASLSIERANRAKYFDVIIPIVPFVTADNARDLLLQIMKPHVADPKNKVPGISPALIRIAARHVADMRTMRSLRNEFEIHADRLITSASSKMPEISADIVFSLVLLRATSPLTFENIRLSRSNLDTLVDRWIDLVESNTKEQTAALTDLRTQLQNGTTLEARAQQAGKKLEAIRPQLRTLVTNFTPTTTQFSGPLDDADLGNTAGWQRISDGERLIATLIRRDNSYSSSTQSVALSASVLTFLIGMPINPDAWKEADTTDLTKKVRATETEISFLRHHTWAELLTRTDLVTAPLEAEATWLSAQVPATPTTKISFSQLVEYYSPTDLAHELITHGFLPRHFARYSSMFYGQVVGLNATEYISRAIEPGTPIIEYELDDESVEQILIEQQADQDDAADLFDDTSVYNLDIIDYLLRNRPRAAHEVGQHLATRWGELEQEIVSRFFQRNITTAEKLAAFMAPAWPVALRYTTVDAVASPKARLRLVNAVLEKLYYSDRNDLDADVGRYLSEWYSQLPAIVDPPNGARARVTMRLVRNSGGTIDDLTPLNTDARAAAAEMSIYPITEANLRALRDLGGIALDVLSADREPVFRHAISHLPSYLLAVPQIDAEGLPIHDPDEFLSVLNAVAAGAPEHVRAFIEATPENCRISALQDADVNTWPDLLSLDRADATFANVRQYNEQHGVDEHLGGFLARRNRILTPDATPPDERLALATTVVAARDWIPSAATRVELASSLAPGEIPAVNIASEDAPLVGPLLTAGLLADEAETFTTGILTRWSDVETAIAASASFSDYVDSAVLPARHLASAITSTTIDTAVRATLIDNLVEQLTTASRSDASAVADAVVAVDASIDVDRVLAIRDAGASASSLVGLLAQQGERLPVEHLRKVLVSMPGHYQRLAEGGSGVVRFVVTDAHRSLLTRLERITHTGAHVKQTKSHGVNLEANLKQAP